MCQVCVAVFKASLLDWGGQLAMGIYALFYIYIYIYIYNIYIYIYIYIGLTSLV